MIFLLFLWYKFTNQRNESEALQYSDSYTPTPAIINTDNQGLPAPVKKVVDINQPQICRNKGCDKTFKEKDNREAAWSYYPGPAIFHDRIRRVCININLWIFKSDFNFFYFFYDLDDDNNFLFTLQRKCCDIHVKEFDEFMSIPPCRKGCTMRIAS